jgi:hypothetical protein
MFWPPNELTLAEAFLRGDFDLEGDVEAAGPLGDYLLSLPKNWVERLRLGGRLWSFPSRPHSSHESRAARLSHSPRGTKLLEDLGAEPKVTYLQRQPWHEPDTQ